MLPAIVVENLPRLVRAIKLLPNDPREDAALDLADELTGITAMVAEKFTNERTADGIQKALFLTVGGVSLAWSRPSRMKATRPPSISSSSTAPSTRSRWAFA